MSDEFSVAKVWSLEIAEGRIKDLEEDKSMLNAIIRKKDLEIDAIKNQLTSANKGIDVKQSLIDEKNVRIEVLEEMIEKLIKGLKGEY